MPGGVQQKDRDFEELQSVGSYISLIQLESSGQTSLLRN